MILISNYYYYFTILPIALVACCFRKDDEDGELCAVAAADVELLFIVLLLLFPASKSVAFCLIGERSTAKAICFEVIPARDAAKINDSAKLAKTKVLFIMIRF